MRARSVTRDPRAWAATGALTVVAVAAGAAWVASRNPRWSHDGRRRVDMPALAAGRGARVERTVTILRSPTSSTCAGTTWPACPS